MQCKNPCPLYPEYRPRKRTSANGHVCFTPESGHVQRNGPCLLRATSGHPRTWAGLFAFSLFYSILCRINAGGDLPPVITVLDMTSAYNCIGRIECHPITFGGLVVIPTGLGHVLVSHLSYRGSA